MIDVIKYKKEMVRIESRFNDSIAKGKLKIEQKYQEELDSLMRGYKESSKKEDVPGESQAGKDKFGENLNKQLQQLNEKRSINEKAFLNNCIREKEGWKLAYDRELINQFGMKNILSRLIKLKEQGKNITVEERAEAKILSELSQEYGGSNRETASKSGRKKANVDKSR